MTEILRLDKFSVNYGAVIAVNNVALSVPASGVVAIIGPNGAGKTSLLRAISRLISPRLAPGSGRHEFLGNDCRHETADRLARRGLIHVPEGRGVIPGLTCRENLLVGASASGGRSGSYTFDSVLDLFPILSGLLNRKAGLLSGGEQQMLAIGRALLGAPRLIMIDEPSLGLSPSLVDRLYGAIGELSKTVPLLLVEQSIEFALELALEAHVMVTGRFVLGGRPDELPGQDTLLSTYLGSSVITAED